VRRRAPQAVLMAGGTVLSRATGFLRTAALASVLGLTVTADAYNAAASVPTMLLVLVTGGTLSAALVPILATPATAEGRQRAAAAALLVVAAMGGAGAVGLAGLSPLIADALSAAAPVEQRADRAARLQLLLLLVAPQVWLLGLLVATNGILTVAGRLGRVGATPVLNNVLAIVGVVLFATVAQDDRAPDRVALVVLGGSSTAALAVAVFTQLHACRALLPPLRRMRRSAEPDVFRRLLAVGRWSVLYVASNQVGLLAVLVVAGRATGAVSAYQWAFAIMQLPFAVLAVPVMSAALPRLTTARNDRRRAAAVLMATRALLLLCLVPASAGLLVFGDVAARLLLGGGEPTQVAELAGAVRLFGLALVPFALFQLSTRLCYVVDKNAWPALANLAVNATLLTAAAAALTVPRADVLEVLSLGYVLSYVVGAVTLAVVLSRSGEQGRLAPGLARPAVLVLSGAAAAAGLRSTLSGVTALTLALAVFVGLVAAALWPWRRMRLGAGAPADASADG
jgi:putative peptidoglycan lipid II flippase